MKINSTNPMAELGTAIGVGILAGLAGTVAITISQMIEMKITKREPSTAPVDAVSKVLHVKETAKDKKALVGQEVHWAYGTSWGIVRGLCALSGMKPWQATTAHFLAIWGTEQAMLPALKLAPPITEEKPQAIGIDVWHHAIYALAAGAAYDAMAPKHISLREGKRLWKSFARKIHM